MFVSKKLSFIYIRNLSILYIPYTYNIWLNEYNIIYVLYPIYPYIHINKMWPYMYTVVVYNTYIFML